MTVTATILSTIFLSILSYIVPIFLALRLLNLIVKYRSKTSRLQNNGLCVYSSDVIDNGKIMDGDELGIVLYIPFSHAIAFIIILGLYIFYFFEFIGTYINKKIINKTSNNVIRIFNIECRFGLGYLQSLCKFLYKFIIFDGRGKDERRR